MGNWTAKERLIDRYSNALTEYVMDNLDWKNVNDKFEVNLDFDDYLKSFAEEFESLIIDDIKERINSVL